MSIEEKERSVEVEFIRNIEKRIQKQWEDKKIHESTPNAQEKYFATFPYPYMNGSLHIGHGFTITKAEFVTRYQRMKGRNVLFPFGFHVTGQPIVACADKLKEEISKFGFPPKFPKQIKKEKEKEVEEIEVEEIEGEKISRKARKKYGGKKGGKKKDQKLRQYDIMKLFRVAENEIPDFVDPKKWIDYFPGHAVTHLKEFGAHIDHRRSFVTTESNPYYDKFVHWQFMKLKEHDLIRFGKRISIYSPKDKQLSADHDRSEGEGVNSKEFVILKMRFLEPYPSELTEAIDISKFEKKGVFLGAATLRPETMYGQTNCWIKPNGKYGAYELKNGEIIIISEQAARNMSYQFIFPTAFGECKPIAVFKGDILFGSIVNAPYSKYSKNGVFVLPMSTIDMKKTTGVVTSVPSDSPDDYICYKDFQTKEELRKKYNIKANMVGIKEFIPIVRTKKYGDLSAKLIIKQQKIKSHLDVKKLRRVHDQVYLEGFNNGIMLVGKYENQRVKDIKEMIKNDLVRSGDAFLYCEPEDKVVSRSGCVCVSALTDQWYIRYGDEKWKEKVKKFIKSSEFKTYSPKLENDFIETVDWLNDRGCSRSSGMGSRIPFDKKYLIESLSDSTLYMAYYTIAHYIQSDIYGNKPGIFGVSPDVFKSEVFDYIFLREMYPENCEIPETQLRKARDEFEYWYPFDLRVSARGLIKNHLTMCLFNHVSIFAKTEKYFPKAMFVNGFLKLDNEKMSKSTGNFKLLLSGIEEFSADACRITLADAGDSQIDANFEYSVATCNSHRIYKFIKWSEKVMKDINSFRTKKKEVSDVTKFIDNFVDIKIKEYVNNTIDAYEKMKFRDVCKYGWYDMLNLKSWYEYQVCGNRFGFNMRKDIVQKFINFIVLIMAPVIPHTSEYIFQSILGNGENTNVVNQKFPEKQEINVTSGGKIIAFGEYYWRVFHLFHQKRTRDMFEIQKNNDEENQAKISSGVVFICEDYDGWQKSLLRIMSDMFKANGDKNPGEVFKNMKYISAKIKEEYPEFDSKEIGKMMRFVALKKKEISKIGKVRENNDGKNLWVYDILNAKCCVDEIEFWNNRFIQERVKNEILGGAPFSVKLKSDASTEEAELLVDCKPGNPQIIFVFEK